MRRLALVLSLALVPVQVAADTFPTQERGFQAEKAFHVGDFDTVNLFNGNLVLTIPIGGSYPLGGGLSYGLTLVYNSNVWDYEETASATTQSLPVRGSNSGLGWRLSLGELLDPTDPESESGFWVYVGGDGSEHSFYDRLHEGEAAASTVKYTRDNSYLRLRNISSTEKKVDFGDGTTQTFTWFSSWDWRLTRIEDRFGNWANVTYINDINTGELKSWKLQDQHGRTQTVNLVTATWYNRAVGSVVLTAFNGTTAIWTFGYTQVTIPRACPDNDPQTGNVIVPLLTSVSLPDGSSWSMPTSDYHLDQSAGCRLPGVLKAITTPVLGRVEWVYGGYGFPAETDEKPWRNFAHGVYSRTLKDASGTAQGTWTYTPSLNPVPGPTTPGREAVRTVVTPLGDKTESYFSVAVDESGGWSQFDLDPDGKEAMVFIVGPGDNLFERFGHAAIYVKSGNEGRGASVGGTGGFERGVGGFIRHYTDQEREVTVFILKTTPEQDKKMLSFMKGDANAGNKGGTLGADLMLTQNCTSAVCNVLSAGGVLKPGETADGASTGMSRPSELESSLRSGELSDDATVVLEFDPEADAKAQSLLESLSRASMWFRFLGYIN